MMTNRQKEGQGKRMKNANTIKTLFKKGHIGVNKGKKFYPKEHYKKVHMRNVKIYNKKIRDIVLDWYGHKCYCCGETESNFLTIDHTDGGGRKHRKEIKMSIYQWLVKNNFPTGFQLMCYNCNCAKGFYGVCPHTYSNNIKKS